MFLFVSSKESNSGLHKAGGGGNDRTQILFFHSHVTFKDF